MGPGVPCKHQDQAEDFLEQLHDLRLPSPQKQGKHEPVQQGFVKFAQFVKAVDVASFVAVQGFVDSFEPLFEDIPIRLDAVEEIATDCGDEVVAFNSEGFRSRVCTVFRCEAWICVTK